MTKTSDFKTTDEPRTRMTVGDLRRAIAELPDDMTVVLEIDNYEDSGDLGGAWLRLATPEERCDEVERLYIYGSWDDDQEERESEAER